MSSISNYYTNNFGPWALIAGASEGIGAAIAEELASKGLNIVLLARRKNLLDELSTKIEQRYKIEVKSFVVDLASEELLNILLSKVNGLDIGLLVYNAALSPIGLFHLTSLEDHLKVIDVNVRAPMTLSYFYGNKMKERGKGGIVLMSSLAGYQGNPIHAHYSATKAYNINLAEALWDELKPYGIKVMTCTAGAISSPNYNNSKPKKLGLFAPKAMSPKKVAKELVKALKRKNGPIFVLGAINRFYSFIMQNFLPRKATVKIMGRIARKMYGEEKNHINN